MLTIRPQATADDYQLIADLAHATQPYSSLSVDYLRHSDETRDPKINHGIYIAEYDSIPAGYAVHTQYVDTYQPHELWVTVRVHPDFRRRKIGAHLFQHLLDVIQGDDIHALKAAVKSDDAAAVGFAHAHGFEVYSERIPQTLTMTDFDPAPFAAVLDKVASQGITIKSIAALADDPQRDHKLYQLQSAVDADVPLAEPIVPLTFEQYRAAFLDLPEFDENASMIALDGTNYVGMSTMLRHEDSFDIEMTGTLAAYRRRGIATALKVLCIEYVQTQAGYETISTINDAVNSGMRTINAKIGFEPGAARYSMIKRIV